MLEIYDNILTLDSRNNNIFQKDFKRLFLLLKMLDHVSTLTICVFIWTEFPIRSWSTFFKHFIKFFFFQKMLWSDLEWRRCADADGWKSADVILWSLDGPCGCCTALKNKHFYLKNGLKSPVHEQLLGN